MIRIGLIGDRDESVIAHRAIPVAIELAAKALDLNAQVQWCPTDSIDEQELQRFHGLWCVPASPYRDMDGALCAIRFAREYGRPFLGTCGGFQHAIIEYARNVLGWSNADHAEMREELTAGALCVAAVDSAGEVRGLELAGHPFFVLTLFQPERVALRGVVPPIVKSFLSECVRVDVPS